MAKKTRGKYVPKFAEPEQPEQEASTAVAAPPVAESPAKTRKKAIRADLQKLTTDGDLVDIWERRILNPNHQESLPIRITTPGMHLRWINLSNRGRFQRARYEQGWVPVHKSELVDEREIYGATFTHEGHVCRGEKQSEMLMRMPQAVYDKIRKKRAELNAKSYKNLKNNLASAGQRHFGDKYNNEAGDVAADVAGKFVGDVKFGTERVSTDELLD